VHFDPQTYTFHDVCPEVLATATSKGGQSARPMADPGTFTRWPGAVTVPAARDDRFFPVEFRKSPARERDSESNRSADHALAL
jgi:hypothetical protein